MKGHILLIAAILLWSFVPNFVQAQSYVQLSPSSNLHCIYLPNGKTQIARSTSRGFRKISFETADKDTAKRLSKLREQALEMRQLINTLNKKKKNGALFTSSLSAKQIKAVLKSFTQGKLDPHFPESLSETIAKVAEARRHILDQIAYYQQLISLIKKCKKKVVPSPGTVPIVYGRVMSSPYRAQGDLSGSGYVAAFAVLPWPWVILNENSWFCFLRPSGTAVSYNRVSAVPCYTELLSSIPGACDHLISYDAEGRPLTGVATLAKRNFYFKERTGGVRFEDAARAAEASLRSSSGYLDSVSYAAVKSVNSCSLTKFK